MSGRLDALVRVQLKKWPDRPPGLARRKGHTGSWLRARPVEDHGAPFLKLPGTNTFKTLPDGLWLSFGGTLADPCVDIICVEACSTFQNMLDKRSRFAPSTQSLLAVCPLAWLLAPLGPHDRTARWQTVGFLKEQPTANLVTPVRDIRVLFGLRERHFRDFASNQVPHAHEFFCPLAALTDDRAYDHPEMQALMARLSSEANFFPLR